MKTNEEPKYEEQLPQSNNPRRKKPYEAPYETEAEGPFTEASSRTSASRSPAKPLATSWAFARSNFRSVILD
jgi:hypothetical protein